MDLSWSCYGILGAAEDANYEEIKSKYRAAVLALHPDKLLVVSRNTSGQEEDNGSVNGNSNRFSEQYRRFNFSASGRAGSGDGSISAAAAGEVCGLNGNDDLGNEESGEGEGEERNFGLLSLFFRVQKAWEVLRDPESRAAHDRTLSAERFAREVASHGGDSVRVIVEEICLGDMDIMSRHAGGLIHDEEVDGEGEDEDEGLSYPCRCGDLFMVSFAELRGMGVEFSEEGSLQAEAMDGRGGEDGGDDRGRDYQSGALKISGASISREELNLPRIRADSEQAQKQGPDSLVLPCQSCSLHVKLHLRNTLKSEEFGLNKL